MTKKGAVRRVLKAARQAGWRIERGGGGHYRLYPDDRDLPPMTVASSPGARRSLANMLADARRRGLNI